MCIATFPDELIDPIKDEMARGDNVDKLGKGGRSIPSDQKKPQSAEASRGDVPSRPAVGFWTWVVRISAPVAIAISIVAWIQPQWATHRQNDLRTQIDQQIDAKIKEPMDTLNQQSRQLSGIQASIDAIQKDLELVLKKELKISALLPQEQFNKNLDVIATDTRLAQTKNLSIERNVLTELRMKLRGAPQSAENYGPALSSFIAYDSTQRLGRPFTPQMLTPCPVLGTPNGVLNGLDGGPTFGCAFLLDGQKIENSNFHDSIIEYDGGSLYLKNVTFKNCYFIMKLPERPGPLSYQFARAILEHPETLNFKALG